MWSEVGWLRGVRGGREMCGVLGVGETQLKGRTVGEEPACD
jgi:hypothetical protein